MIIFAKDKRLEGIDNWVDITELAGFQEVVDPANKEFHKALAFYNLAVEPKCGLKDCRSSHMVGCVVEFKDGSLTNIGNVCGTKRFGLQFDRDKRTLEHALREQQMREVLSNAKSKAPGWIESIEAVREAANGVNWCYSKLLDIRSRRKVPEQIVKAISQIVRTGNGSVFKVREATQEEVERESVRTGRKIKLPWYIEEQTGNIGHTTALAGDIRQLAIELKTELNNLLDLDVENIEYTALKSRSKWAGGIEGDFDVLYETLSAQRAFLTKQNLQPLTEILDTASEKKEWSVFLEGLP